MDTHIDDKIHTTALRALAQRTDDDALSDDELLASLEDDPELERLREARLTELKRQIDATKDMQARGHGEYTQITKEEELIHMISDSHNTAPIVVHFSHAQFARCKILERHLRELAKRRFGVKFVEINVQDCSFLVAKFGVRMLPCVLVVRGGRVVDRFVGFEEFGNSDRFETRELEARLAKSGIFKVAKSSDDE